MEELYGNKGLNSQGKQQVGNAAGVSRNSVIYSNSRHGDARPTLNSGPLANGNHANTSQGNTNSTYSNCISAFSSQRNAKPGSGSHAHTSSNHGNGTSHSASGSGPSLSNNITGFGNTNNVVSHSNHSGGFECNINSGESSKKCKAISYTNLYRGSHRRLNGYTYDMIPNEEDPFE